VFHIYLEPRPRICLSPFPIDSQIASANSAWRARESDNDKIAVTATRLQSSPTAFRRERSKRTTPRKPPPPSADAVFVVTYHKWGEDVEPQVKVLGVYTTAGAANEHVLVFVAADKYGEGFGEITKDEDQMPWRGEGRAENSYRVDAAGCLMLYFDMGGNERIEIRVLKKALAVEAPARPSRSVASDTSRSQVEEDEEGKDEDDAGSNDENHD
jgi:hypothetical protein